MSSKTVDVKNCVLHGIHFLQAVKHEIGDEAAVDAFNALQEILGKTWSGAIIFSKLQRVTSKFVTLSSIGPSMKINVIRAIRNIAGVGLKEAKDITDQVEARQPYMFNFSANSDEEIVQFMEELRGCGCKIEFS